MVVWVSGGMFAGSGAENAMNYHLLIFLFAQNIGFMPTNFPPSTTAIDLSQNMLRRVTVADWTAILQLPSLQQLDISGASIASLAWVTESVSLRKLVISDNDLTRLPSFATWTPGLTNLDVSSNPLKTLPSNTFAGLQNLSSLNLAQTQLTQLSAGVFDSLAALRTLDISGNFLSALPTSLLSSKLNQLNFLAVTQNIAVGSAAVNVSLLQGLQGVFWVEEKFCAAGFYSVGQKVCLRCPIGTYQNAEAARSGDTDWLSCGLCPGITSSVCHHIDLFYYLFFKNK